MSQKREVKVAGIQLKCIVGKKEEIVYNALGVLEKAGKEDVQIAQMGELFSMEYDRFLQREFEKYKPMFEIAEPIPGPTINKVSKIAKKYKMYIIAPIFEKAGPGVYYNSAAIIDPKGDVIGITRKRHIPAVQSLEKLYFRPGSEFPVYDAPFGKFGVGICFDRRFPETARILALNGAEIYFNPVAAGGYVKETYEMIARMRAIDNAMFSVFVNRVGDEGKTHFFGDSIICDPWGKIIASGEEKENEVVSAVIDLEDANTARIESGVFRDLRPDIYHRITAQTIF
ncbi:MAG: carbon-nitrogen hydrolase family protein [Deltaproteobacteria bacterium]|nr:carbon-nitrogen hydrolase family protein [Deltaproteobacteria bacterium]